MRGYIGALRILLQSLKPYWAHVACYILQARLTQLHTSSDAEICFVATTANQFMATAEKLTVLQDIHGMDIHWFWGTWTSKMRIQTRNSFPEQCGCTQINISHRSHCSNPPQHGEIQHNEPRTLGCVDAKKKGPTLRLNWIMHQYCWNQYTLVLHFWYKLVMIGTKSISFANLLQHWGDEQPTKDHHWIIWGRPAGHWPLDRTKW